MTSVSIEAGDPTSRALARRHFFRYYGAARSPLDASGLAFLATGEANVLTVDDERICYWSWGHGPNVFLLHGVYGNAAQFNALVGPLVARGYRVTAFDAPGHGQSGGDFAHGDLVARVLLALQANLGRVDTVIAHSLASVWLAYSSEHGFCPDRLVLVSPLASADRVFKAYVKLQRLAEPLLSQLRSMITDFEGPECWRRFSPSEVARAWRIPGLIIHDQDDRVVPATESAEIVRSWPTAKLITTNQCGHFEILRSPLMIDGVLSFLDATAGLVGK